MLLQVMEKLKILENILSLKMNLMFKRLSLYNDLWSGWDKATGWCKIMIALYKMSIKLEKCCGIGVYAT